jgi:hypothetical protein
MSHHKKNWLKQEKTQLAQAQTKEKVQAKMSQPPQGVRRNGSAK